MRSEERTALNQNTIANRTAARRSKEQTALQLSPKRGRCRAQLRYNANRTAAKRCQEQTALQLSSKRGYYRYRMPAVLQLEAN